MCGIAGYIVRASAGMPRSVAKQMADAIAHRGPDDEGYLDARTRDGGFEVALAFRRLSIIDLSTGHQPIGNETGDVQVIFNGELYNFESLRDELIRTGHRFRTKSDTETVVHAYEQWGTECVERFRGMFGFALWDAGRERLVLARDRFGKKPVFLAETHGGFGFASEIKALLRIPGLRAEVDTSALPEYFRYRYVPGPRTLFRGIRKMMPGTIAVWERGRLVESRYYTPPDAAAIHESSVPEVTDPVGAFLEKLDESVRIRMISDVPFGAFLSGGIDSSAVVALMSRHSSTPVRTFSVGFKESRYSELAYAKVIADQFRTEHHELQVSESEIMDLLPMLVRFRDAPVAEPSDIPIYMLAREARRTVKMVLTGEGSDEFLAGYPKHAFERFARVYQVVPGVVRERLIEPLAAALPYRFRRMKTAIATMGVEDASKRLPRWFGAIDEREADRLLHGAAALNGHVAGVQFESGAGNSALRRALYFDQTSWLPDNLLERGDRMTMAASLEARMPFMDHELAAMVSALPDRWRLHGMRSKYILRRAMQRLLPSEILEREKVGFRVPVNEWFRGPMQGYVRELLLSGTSCTRGYYDKAELTRIVDEHVRGRQNHEKLIWTLLNLEIWHREYGVAA